MAMTAEKQTVFAWIDQHRAELSRQHLAVWNFAEPAWREYRSAAFYVDVRTIGATLVELMTSPAEIARARAEFVERTGGGIGGSKWVPPLLPKGFRAPVHYRWPECVTTPRGEEWWIPNGPEGAP